MVNTCVNCVDSNGDLHHLCIASYRFPKGKIPQALPHGNSKSDVAFHPTWPSTMAKIKKEAKIHGPKDTVNNVSSSSGGMIKACGIGQLPRNEHQVSNMKYTKKKASVVCDGDELFVAMTDCKSKDVTARFVRDVKAAPDPALVLANDQQLNDLVRFCTNAEEFSIVTVDPTFNLGEFDVTPITYQHLLLQTERSSNHPTFLGPILIHFRKNFSTYLYFASTLIGLKRDLEKLKAFGTDGEAALVDAFSHEFGFALHLSCAIHLRRNIKQQLHSQHFPEEHIKTTLEEIFGASKGLVHLDGLIDCKSCEEFDNKLALLKPIWDARESRSSTSSTSSSFYEWFMTHKAEILKTTALYPIRVEAGLGNPPKLFTTNASESLNAVIKSKVNYEKNELGKFIDKMKCLANDQQQEIERAVCSRGKYRFCSQYSFLEIDEQKWFGMTPEARSKHMSKVHNATLVPVGYHSCGSTLVCSTPSVISFVPEPADKSISLSVQVDSFADNVSIPTPVLQGIWDKATELINAPQKIAPAPGCSMNSRMVESKSGSRPHLVTGGKGNKFSCDGDCANYKAFGICSHVVAVANVTDLLPAFLNTFQKQKKVPNLTNLAMVGMPKGRGYKGGKPPRKRTKTNPEIRVPFNPMTTCESMNANYTRSLSESNADIHPSNFSSQGYFNNSFSDQVFSASPFQCSYFPPAYSTQSCVLPSTASASHGECSYRLPTLQGQNLSLPSSSLNLLPPPLVPLQPTPIVTNMNTQNVSGGMCNVIVSQTALEPSNQADLEQRPFNLHFISGNMLDVRKSMSNHPRYQMIYAFSMRNGASLRSLILHRHQRYLVMYTTMQVYFVSNQSGLRLHQTSW